VALTLQRLRFTVLDLLLAIATLGATVGWAAGLAGPAPDRASAAAWFWGSLLGLIIAVVPNLLVHEAGHFLAATALRLEVLGVRLWHLQLGSGRHIPGTAGHVRIALARAGRRVPLRMILSLLAGPAANLALAAVAAIVAAEGSVSVWGRAGCVGVSVSGVSSAIGNLIPQRRTPGHANDGRQVLDWALHRQAARERVALADDVADLREVDPAGPPQVLAAHDDRVRAAVADPRAAVATAAMLELVKRQAPTRDMWADADLVATFVARTDIPAAVRATLGSTCSLRLSWDYVTSLGEGERTDPDSPQVERIDRLTRAVLAADDAALTARTALGLLRVFQDRPAEALHALTDIDPLVDPVARSRAHAVRGIAEAELGEIGAAVTSRRTARRLAPNEPFVALLDAVLASRATGG
jgi:hypothetical protein